MKILLTGATGYIGKRLIPHLLIRGHEVICCVRDKNVFSMEKYRDKKLSVVEVDFLNETNHDNLPKDVDIAYYLIHSMANDLVVFDKLEQKCALNFKKYIDKTTCLQIIYLTGIQNAAILSKHLQSRKTVEEVLRRSCVPVTALRAGIIIGSGSVSFEIVRDLVEKIPVMIAPKWIKTKCQPIAIRNVLEILLGVVNLKETFNKFYDIGGPEVVSYKKILEIYAKFRKLSRKIFILPILTPRLSSYWLSFITTAPYFLARNLVDSLSVEVICHKNDLMKKLGIQLIDYETSIALAFDKIEHNQVISSWKDALVSGTIHSHLSDFFEVPLEACYKDIRKFKCKNIKKSMDKIFSIGGTHGWYSGNILWEIRGFLDKLIGGVGLRRGRKNQTELSAGDALDFWRVLIADKKAKRLLLYAEMKLPGEAWLEFKIDAHGLLIQTATFRPLGLLGRLYWFAVYPFHGFIFKGMAKSISQG